MTGLVLYKAPNEDDRWGIALTGDDLEEGESLTGSPAVRILLDDGSGTLTDVSAEFGGEGDDLEAAYGPVTKNGVEYEHGITWRMQEAQSDAEQVRGAEYWIEAKYETDSGRQPIKKDRQGYLPRLVIR